MKVLILADEFAYGGIEAFLENLTRYLRKSKKAEVHCHYWQHKMSNPTFFTSKKSIVVNYTSPFIIRMASNFIRQHLSFYQFFLTVKPDLLLLNGNKSTILSLLVILIAKLVYGTKIVFQFHGARYLEKEHASRSSSKNLIANIKLALVYITDKIGFTLADKIIVLSDYASKLLIETYFIKKSKIITNLPGPTIEFDKFISKKSAKNKLKLDPKSRLLLIMTRMEPRKGSFQIHEILKNIKTKDTVAVICSAFQEPKGSIYFFFESFDQTDLKMPAYLFHNPTLEQKKLFFQACDCVILPSIDLETFGFITLETLKARKLIFGYNIGATKEILRESSSSLLVNDIDPKKLAASVDNYLKNPSAYSDTKLHLSKIITDYSWKKYSEKLLQII